MSLKAILSKKPKLPTGNINLVQVPRNVTASMSRWFSRHLPKTDNTGARALYTFINTGKSNNKRLRGLMREIGLPVTGKNADAFCENVLAMAETYRQLLGTPCVGLRVDIGTAAVGWHTDRDDRDPRMLVTLHGKGTEWVHERDVDKREIHTNAIWVSPDAKVQRTPVGWLNFVRGGREHGLIHRSPNIDPCAKRLLLIFEPTTGEHIAESRYTFKVSLRDRLSRC